MAFSVPEAIQTYAGKVVASTSSRKVQAGICFLAGLYMLKKANNQLSLWAHNNYTSDKSWDWKKELVVITGGCGGIGAQIVSLLAAKHVKVVIFDIVEPQDELAPNCFFFKVDITSSDEIHAAAQQIRLQHGEPTVLINNAGFGSATPVLTISETLVRKVFDVNIISHFLLLKEFLPAMVTQNHGHIVTLASMASFMVQASNVDYACTKAATLAFHEGLNQELKLLYKAPAVRTTIVHPSWVNTPMISQLSRNRKFKLRTIEPEEVANAIVHQLFSGQGAQIVLPSSGTWVSGVRGFPLWLQETLRTKVSTTMQEAMGK